LIGLRLETLNTEFAAAAREERLLVVPAGDNTVRLLPPLVATDGDIGEAMRRLDATAARIERAKPRQAAE